MKPLAVLLLAAFPAEPALAQKIVIKSPEEITEDARKLRLPEDTRAYAVTFVEPCFIVLPDPKRVGMREFRRLKRHELRHCRDGNWHE